MPIEVGIWRIDNGDVRRVNAASLEAERRLEDVLVKEITILGLGPLLILNRQVRTEFGGYIDILALDSEGPSRHRAEEGPDPAGDRRSGPRLWVVGLESWH
jgi:hypothetical protein